ncbi:MULTISPECIES: hypothetical protein [unclassified Streptomyces]|uniref:hypothetical protein n=1 Tax=unclassified Streptomyces TaxID=2593676 RepID=UPI0009663F0C|nr:hypothetical protein AMK10_07475 [Streptomyces sp. CB02058]
MGESGLGVGDGSTAGGVVTGLPPAGAEELVPLGVVADAEADASPAPEAAEPAADPSDDGIEEAEAEADAEEEGVACGLCDTTSPLGAGRTSTSSECFSSWPERGSQGALELPPSRATTSVTAYTAQIAASTQPTRRYVLLRRPLSSTKTGPSEGSGRFGSTGSSES